jgi:hypothetical protein
MFYNVIGGPGPLLVSPSSATGWMEEVAWISVKWKQLMSRSKTRTSSYRSLSLLTMASQPRMKNNVP